MSFQPRANLLAERVAGSLEGDGRDQHQHQTDSSQQQVRCEPTCDVGYLVLNAEEELLKLRRVGCRLVGKVTGILAAQYAERSYRAGRVPIDVPGRKHGAVAEPDGENQRSHEPPQQDHDLDQRGEAWEQGAKGEAEAAEQDRRWQDHADPEEQHGADSGAG